MPKTKSVKEIETILIDDKFAVKFNVNQIIWIISKLNLKSPGSSNFSSITLNRNNPTYTGFCIKGPLKITSIKIDLTGVEYKANDDLTYKESSIFESLELAVEYIKNFKNLN